MKKELKMDIMKMISNKIRRMIRFFFKKKEINTNNLKDLLPEISKVARKNLLRIYGNNPYIIAVSRPEEISNATGIKKNESIIISRVLIEKLGLNYCSGIKVFKSYKANTGFITTSSKNLNKILRDGIETGKITHVFGEYRTGKTQLGQQLCVNVQLPIEKGGLGASAIYIDTEGKFSPERIIQMAEAKNLDSMKVFSRIHVARAYHSDHQIILTRMIHEKMKEHEDIRLIVIDSIISHFRSEYDSAKTGERQDFIKSHILDLRDINSCYPNVAIVFTNQITSSYINKNEWISLACGGTLLSHMANVMILLRKGKDNVRIAKIINAPDLPEKEAEFVITDKGIED